MKITHDDIFWGIVFIIFIFFIPSILVISNINKTNHQSYIEDMKNCATLTNKNERDRCRAEVTDYYKEAKYNGI